MNEIVLNVNSLPEQLMGFFQCERVKVMESDTGVRLVPVDTEEDGDFGAPESLIVRTKEELYAKIEEAEKSFAEGRTVDFDEMMVRLEKKYGL